MAKEIIKFSELHENTLFSFARRNDAVLDAIYRKRDFNSAYVAGGTAPLAVRVEPDTPVIRHDRIHSLPTYAR